MAKRKPKVLVVDDQESVRIAVTMVLEDEGYQVLEASNAKDAISLIKKENPHLMLIDRNMPDLNGVELLKEIRMFSNIKTIMMSGQVLDAETKASIERLGVLDYLDKPVDSAHLCSALKKNL